MIWLNLNIQLKSNSLLSHLALWTKYFCANFTHKIFFASRRDSSRLDTHLTLTFFGLVNDFRSLKTGIGRIWAKSNKRITDTIINTFYYCFSFTSLPTKIDENSKNWEARFALSEWPASKEKLFKVTIGVRALFIVDFGSSFFFSSRWWEAKISHSCERNVASDNYIKWDWDVIGASVTWQVVVESLKNNTFGGWRKYFLSPRAQIFCISLFISLKLSAHLTKRPERISVEDVKFIRQEYFLHSLQNLWMMSSTRRHAIHL